MIKIITILLLFFSLSKAHAKIRVVYYTFPPDAIETKKGPQGAAIEVWEKAAKKSGVPIEWVGPVPFLRALNMVETGKADAIYRLVRTPERESQFVFSDEAPFWGKTGIVVLKSEPLNKIVSDKDISGRKIGWLRGGTPPPFLERNRDKIAWESVSDNSITVNMTKLEKKRIWGVYFVFSATAMYYLSEHHKIDTVKILPFPGSERLNYMYPAFSKKSDPILVAKMNKAFSQEIPTYDYEKLSQKYIDLVGNGLVID